MPSGIVDELASAIRGTLGADLLGLYLYGSIVTGDFEPDASDIDLLAVLAREVRVDDFEPLDGMHREFVGKHPEWANRLDVVYVGQETLASFREGSGVFAVVSPGDPFHLRHDPADWLQTWYLAGQGSRALFGPPVVEVLPSIDRSEFVAAIIEAVGEHADRARHAQGGALAYTVLTVCRTLTTLATGTMPSKAEAAVWASTRFPEWAELIDSALTCRRTGGRVGFRDEATRHAAQAFLARVAGEVQALGSQLPHEP